MCPYVSGGNKIPHSLGSKSAKPELIYISAAVNFKNCSG